jgi:hypothetical protein
MTQRQGQDPSRSSRRHVLKLATACFTLGGGPAWKRVTAAPPEQLPAVVVLDDCDPVFQGDVNLRNDGLRLLSADGKELGRVGGLNNCQSIAMNHGIAIDPERVRIYARELVAHQVTATDLAGKVVWRAEQTPASAMAVEPESGDLWCLVDDGAIGTGKLVVLDMRGNRRTSYPVRGTDIAYDAHDRSFWIVGTDIVRVDRNGRELLKLEDFAKWTCVSVAPIPGTGEAWIVERRHPDVAGSRSRLLRMTTKGEIRQTVEREDWNPIGVACEPSSGQAWVVDYRKSLVRVPIGEVARDPVPIPALAVAIGHKSGYIWVATADQVIQLKLGVPVVKTPLGKPSGQVWLAAF